MAPSERMRRPALICLPGTSRGWRLVVDWLRWSLLGMSKFLLSVVGIQELVAGQVPGIKPLQENIRFLRALLRQRDHRVSGGLLTIGWNCFQGCIEVSL